MSNPEPAVSARPYRQGARAQAQQRTREALMAVTLDEFYAGRWQQVSLEAVARSAKVTKQTLLRHFGSKEELLLQSLLGSVQQVLDERWSAPQGDIAGIVENVVSHYEVWGERARHIGDWQSGPAALADISQAGRQLHYDWVEYAFAPQLKSLRGRARRQRRATLIALCDVQFWWVLAHDLKLPRTEVSAILTRLIEHTVREGNE
jgi:AcrR family transcriptional regulator